MIRGLWTAASGMVTQQTKIDIVSNNLANVNTTGFKKSRSNFQGPDVSDASYCGASTPGGGQIPTGIQVGMGAKTSGTQKIFSQGDYVQTGNELDMAIEGKGFFKVLRGDTEYYTRAGNFMLDSEGYITNSAGDRLQPEISLPEDTVLISIQSNGQLTAYGSGDEELTTAEIYLYSFPNPAGLYAAGSNLLLPTEVGEPIEGTPGSEGFGTIANMFLENSNVSVVEEMVEMIVSQRAYEANSKAIQTADSMLQMANNIKR